MAVFWKSRILVSISIFHKHFFSFLGGVEVHPLLQELVLYLFSVLSSSPKPDPGIFLSSVFWESTLVLYGTAKSIWHLLFYFSIKIKRIADVKLKTIITKEREQEKRIQGHRRWPLIVHLN